jgi:hypothetical protein
VSSCFLFQMRSQRLRPNFFLCVAIKEASLVATLVAEQDRLGIQDLTRIPPSKFHFTLGLLRLEKDVDSQIARVGKVLESALASVWAFEQVFGVVMMKCLVDDV